MARRIRASRNCDFTVADARAAAVLLQIRQRGPGAVNAASSTSSMPMSRSQRPGKLC